MQVCRFQDHPSLIRSKGHQHVDHMELHVHDSDRVKLTRLFFGAGNGTAKLMVKHTDVAPSFELCILPDFFRWCKELS